MSDSEENQRAEDEWAAAMDEQIDAEDKAIDKQADTDQEANIVQHAAMDNLVEESVGGDTNVELESILDIPVSLSVRIGQTRLNIRNLLQLNQGSVVELDRLAGEPLDVLVNGTLVAHGEIVVVNEKYGIRLTDIVSAHERVKKLQ